MADLYHLLDEVEQQDDPLQTVEDGDAWELDQNELEHPPEVPPVLVEAARRQQQERSGMRVPVMDDDGDNDGDMMKNETKDKGERTAGMEDENFAHLKFLWIQEKQSPELLPMDADLIRLQMKRLQEQDDYIETLQASCDLSSLTINMFKIDADRMRFVLTDLMRTRLRKLEEHALYNLREMIDRMTEEEEVYLTRYQALMERHLRRTVLDHMPKEAWKKLDAPEMIDEPDLSQYVFCKVNETVELDNGSGVDLQEPGTCLIARYNAIREYILERKVELMM